MSKLYGNSIGNCIEKINYFIRGDINMIYLIQNSHARRNDIYESFV